MGGLFRTKVPQMPQPTPAPQIDQDAIDQQKADLMRKRRGRAATVLAGGSAAPGAASLARQTLLGG